MNNYQAINLIELDRDDPWNDNDYTEAFQHLIDTGMVWNLQGFYGREASRLIFAGVCSNTQDGNPHA